MSALAQQTLFGHIVDIDALRVISDEGLDPEVIPTIELRPVFEFAVDYFFRSGMNKAPSEAVLRSEFGDVLDDNEIDLSTEPEDSVEWALDDLKSTYLHRQVGLFNRELATAMAEAQSIERHGVVNDFSTKLVSLSLSVESRAKRVELSAEAEGIIRAYEARAADRGDFKGMGFGLPEIDRQTYGIHQGELAIIAAGPKSGKSMWMCWTALKEWERGRVVSLFTLENSVEMMLDRIACMANHVDANAWMRGEASEAEVARVAEWVGKVSQSDTPLYVLQPDMGQRSVEHMVREAQLRRTDSLLIDQLTFVEVGQGSGDRRGRHEKIGEALHQLKAMISTGRHKMSCLLAHQINREGVKAADKTGHLEMHHLAEAAETERTADFIFGAYASNDNRLARRLGIQMLGARRTATKNWILGWRPEVGLIKVIGEMEIE